MLHVLRRLFAPAEAPRAEVDKKRLVLVCPTAPLPDGHHVVHPETVIISGQDDDPQLRLVVAKVLSTGKMHVGFFGPDGTQVLEVD